MAWRRPVMMEVFAEARAPVPFDPKACRKDTQRRLQLLAPTNDATTAERVATDLLLRRCRNCGECWMARL